jgi:hypothetical protein
VPCGWERRRVAYGCTRMPQNHKISKVRRQDQVGDAHVTCGAIVVHEGQQRARGAGVELQAGFDIGSERNGGVGHKGDLLREGCQLQNNYHVGKQITRACDMYASSSVSLMAPLPVASNANRSSHWCTRLSLNMM